MSKVFRQPREVSVKGRKGIAEYAQRVEGLNNWALEVFFNLFGGVVVTVDVTANIGALEQLHVIGAGHCAHVVDLGDPW